MQCHVPCREEKNSVALTWVILFRKGEKKTKVTLEKKTHTRISWLIFEEKRREEKRRQYLFLPDFIAFFQINSLHSDHYIHKDLECSHHGLFIPVFSGQENHESSARTTKSQNRHLLNVRLQPCHYTSLPDIIMLSREIWVNIPHGTEQRMLLSLIHNTAIFSRLPSFII